MCTLHNSQVAKRHPHCTTNNNMNMNRWGCNNKNDLRILARFHVYLSLTFITQLTIAIQKNCIDGIQQFFHQLFRQFSAGGHHSSKVCRTVAVALSQRSLRNQPASSKSGRGRLVSRAPHVYNHFPDEGFSLH